MMINNGAIISLTERISLMVKETIEDFIIETIEPYCSEVAEIKISKEELKRLILKNYGKPKTEHCIEDIELVIKIPEETYEAVCNEGMLPTNIIKAITNGTPLPKGHGKLGDLDKIKKEMQNYHDDCAKTSEYTRLGFETAIGIVEGASTIIEADVESED